MKLFKNQQCDQLLYFENRSCENCGHRLGYLHQPGMLCALEPAGDAWRSLAQPNAVFRFCFVFRVCANEAHDTCNWMLPADSPELARHRLFSTLIRLRLPLPNGTNDPTHGIAKILKGHEDGLITINLNEADDGQREICRVALGEAYRILPGHLRHETGHYFWDTLVRANRPAPNWQQNYFSHYAAPHHWENFAGPWVHYLHLVDTLEMAYAFGIRIRPRIHNDSDLAVAVEIDFDPHNVSDIRSLTRAWLPPTCAGHPFVLGPAVHSCGGGGAGSR